MNHILSLPKITLLILIILIPETVYAQPARVLARSGEQGIEDVPYFVFKRFGSDNGGLPLQPPIINKNGDVRFFASLGGPVGTGDTALYVHSGGAWRSVARRFTTVPGYPSGTSFESFLSAQLAENADIVLSARLTGDTQHVQMGVNDRGVWRSTATDFSELARTNNVAPQTNPSALYRTLSIPLLTKLTTAQQIVIPTLTRNIATLADANGAFAPSHSTPLRMLEGYAAPGVSGTVLSSLSVEPRSNGAVVYHGSLSGPGVQQLTFGTTTLLNDAALWADDAVNSPQLVARKGQLLQSAGGTVALTATHSNSGQSLGAADGSVLFSGDIIRASTGADAGEGLWRWRASEVRSLFTTGTSVVNAPALTISRIQAGSTSPAIYDCDGHAVYAAVVMGAGVTYLNELALFEDSASGPLLIARARQQAPGTAEGVVFTSNSLLQRIACGKNSNWAFVAQLQGTGVTSSNDRGIWAVSNGQAQLAIREGDQVGHHLIAEIKIQPSYLQTTDDGRLIALVDVVQANNPYGARSLALVSWSPCAGTSIIMGIGVPLALENGSSIALVNFGLDPEQALNGAGTLVARVKFASALPDDEALVTVSLPSCESCPADFDQNGSVDVQDIFSFLSAWFSQNPAADFDQSGAVAVPDIFAFLNAWFSGC